MEQEGKTLWWYFHRYRDLAADGCVKDLSCPDCDAPLTTRINPKNDDLPDLWCASCDNTISPGLDLLTRVRAVVGEWEL